MDWRRVDDYHMRSGFGKGQFYISKGYVAGAARYLLWRSPLVLHGSYDSAEDAKRAAESLVGLDADWAGRGVADSGSGGCVAADAGGGTD